ncbi:MULTISPECIES: ADP-ribose diphosphatase [Salinivibrio]|jgi:nudix-type nucleoside diphosphatase, YffH/AdpP family|uniref:ADP-ribose pyrophosphatase n=1 Tax=Salinivibrio kushneri TaxID=1908198 RepID=A0AB36K358_9GAMM|nr:MULTISPECIES: ADP-ribose diphosphatase [Salinivibrio]ODP98391.1 ADP-ribose diphosphatase [Salinivibrio sp. BNH]OOE35690.1 ADP-ribose diphosphatase [Salinivibrio kushneri]OOE37551.1 ADP-ribose diphosphatase [Salinivibrio kushneri]OOE39585.1 ADP-ribose diphosphatase [Salinivibrio kushneri]OOE42136.1 ADP-ribose diphosphatase [Salinivibrio kushneri]
MSDYPPGQFDRDDIVIEDISPLYQGFFSIQRYQFRHRLFEGGWSGSVVRELFERGHAVAVLPYDPVRDEVVMLEQIRVGAMAAGATPWQLEIVAGMIDKDQSPEQVAHREAREEAGLLLHQMERVTRYLSSSGGCSEQLDVFVAIVDASEAEGVHGLDSENEDILVHRLSRQHAYQKVVDGEIENAASIIALQWLELNASRLRQSYNEQNSK